MRFAAVIAVVAWASLVGDILIDVVAGTGLGEVVWGRLRFFTILTNLVVALVFTRAALSGRPPSASLSGAVTVWITVVGAVYWALLAATHDVSGLGVLTNHGLHSVVPALVVIWWVAQAPKRLGWRAPAVWILYPLGYLAYALGRAMIDGVYPYFFLNLETQGLAGVLVWSVGLCALFYGLGIALVGAGRLLAR